jgi:hypothetical protein
MHRFGEGAQVQTDNGPFEPDSRGGDDRIGYGGVSVDMHRQENQMEVLTPLCQILAFYIDLLAMSLWQNTS